MTPFAGHSSERRWGETDPLKTTRRIDTMSERETKRNQAVYINAAGRYDMHKWDRDRKRVTGSPGRSHRGFRHFHAVYSSLKMANTKVLVNSNT
jgi:hypothetical protein